MAAVPSFRINVFERCEPEKPEKCERTGSQQKKPAKKTNNHLSSFHAVDAGADKSAGQVLIFGGRIPLNNYGPTKMR
jgi:hypothetical protein